MHNQTLIIDLQYFGNYNYYKTLIQSKFVYFEQFDRHLKKSFANRMMIAGSNGTITLSVPLVEGRSQQTISKDVRISNSENWQLRHYRSIVSSYNSSPWFIYFSDKVADLYKEKFGFLLDWNIACLNLTLNILQYELHYGLTTKWSREVEGVLDYRDKMVPGKDLPGKSIRYSQVFENRLGFLPGLSILDLLCCEGPKRTLMLLKDAE